MSSVIITQDEYTAINSTVEVLRAQLADVTAERDWLDSMLSDETADGYERWKALWEQHSTIKAAIDAAKGGGAK